jgi:hypothetical protein
VGDTLTVEYDFNSGSPVRRYKRNGTTLRTDTTGIIVPIQEIQSVCFTTGDLIGDVFFEVVYDGCESRFLVSPVGSSGTSTVGTSETFDVLAYQIFDRPEDVLQVEIFSENL